MPVSLRILIACAAFLLIDLYFYQAVSTVLKGSTSVRKTTAFYIYWGFTFVSFVMFFAAIFGNITEWPKFIRVYVFPFFIIVIISKIIGTVFIALDDIIRLFRWTASYFISQEPAPVAENIHHISRLKFLNMVAVGMAALPFAGFIYGMIKGAFDYKVHKIKVVLPNLPSAFNGLKIVQISDIHSGSFVSSSPLEAAVKIVNEQKADVVFFTGDLVNNKADEMEPFIDVLGKIVAPLGVFSTLGNHDYGDYVQWESKEAKAKNLEDLKEIHSKMGWRLLMNEHSVLKRGEAEIAVIGVENWGGNFNFPRYGNLAKAHSGTEKHPVKLLLSHDPSHWSLQVKEEFKDIDITFSGHTHGFQFGIEIPGFKWSPSQYVYKQWAGLYSGDKQHLYVNRGLGFLGYPGRVGILPEITVMELFNS